MIHYPNGVWPMMLTPYRMDDMVDHEGLAALTHWYMANGVAGLFAACQPSEIFRLSPQECAALMGTTVKSVDGRATVVASGHVSTRRCLKRSSLKLFNASTATLLETLLQGAAGFSGVIANFLRGFMHGCAVARSKYQPVGQRKAADQGGAGNATADGADVRRYLEHLR